VRKKILQRNEGRNISCRAFRREKISWIAFRRETNILPTRLLEKNLADQK